MAEKRLQTYLTLEQRRDVAIWLIENKHVTVDKNTDSPDFIYFRTKTQLAVDEINQAMIGTEMPKLTYHNLKASLDFFNKIKSWSGMKVNVPAIEDTVEMDILVAKVKNLEGQLSQCKLSLIAALELKGKDGKHLDTLHKISQLIPAEAFKKR